MFDVIFIQSDNADTIGKLFLQLVSIKLFYNSQRTSFSSIFNHEQTHNTLRQVSGEFWERSGVEFRIQCDKTVYLSVRNIFAPEPEADCQSVNIEKKRKTDLKLGMWIFSSVLRYKMRYLYSKSHYDSLSNNQI